MKIISFAWTSKVLLDGKKTVTRRDWNDKYARTFHKGDTVQAYDKNPRSGGRKIAEIMLTKEPYKQWLHEVTDEDEIKEGGLWGSGKAYQEAMGDKMKKLWVIEFKLVKTQRETTIQQWFEVIKKM